MSPPLSRLACCALLALLGCLEARPRAEAEVCVAEAERSCPRIHEPGILEAASENFHGRLLARSGYDFDACRRCHGRDFQGGASGVSCRSCHAEGPTTCATCHAGIAALGAHAVHLAGRTVEDPTACAECHLVPSSFSSTGHVFSESGAIDPPPAEIRFGPEATRGAPAAQAPIYDATTRTCGRVACHGGQLAESGASDPTPAWDRTGQGLGCRLCHGMPPPRSYHPDADCGRCHARVATADALRDVDLHGDGAIDLGADGLGTCSSCHADQRAERTHRAHLEAPLRLRGGLDCEACHLTPSALTAPGHLDSPPPAEVFPAGLGGLASARGATPTWDGITCAGTACHGVMNAIAWRAPAQSVFCGSCHGVPPADAAHAGIDGLRACASCHPGSVDAYGNVILVEDPTGTTSLHLDGKVDSR